MGPTRRRGHRLSVGAQPNMAWNALKIVLAEHDGPLFTFSDQSYCLRINPGISGTPAASRLHPTSTPMSLG